MAFYGKTALITGGASGMGKVMATRLANQGAKVAILDLNDKNLEDTAKLSPNIIPFKADVTNLAQIQEIVAKVENEIGPIDRLAHCAAIMPGGFLESQKAEDITKVMYINYFGMVNVVQTVFPYMNKRDKGDFIVFGSIAGVAPAVRFGAYGSTKAATNFFMRVLMEENRKSHIRFQLVCPSSVNTPLVNQAVKDGPQSLKKMQATGKNIDTPEFIIDTIEKALERNKKVNFPGIAKWANLFYRICPSLITRLSNKM